jgi:hypothetical protein
MLDGMHSTPPQALRESRNSIRMRVSCGKICCERNCGTRAWINRCFEAGPLPTLTNAIWGDSDQNEHQLMITIYRKGQVGCA